MTVGENCILGASVGKDTGENGLKEGYGIFTDEVLDVNPYYQPKSVNTDGWKAIINAWKSLFSGISVIACFLHVSIKICDRSSKRFKDLFDSVGDKIWDCYEAESKASFSQRVGRLCEWADAEKLPAVVSTFFPFPMVTRDRPVA